MARKLSRVHRTKKTERILEPGGYMEYKEYGEALLFLRHVILHLLSLNLTALIKGCQNSRTFDIVLYSYLEFSPPFSGLSSGGSRVLR